MSEYRPPFQIVPFEASRQHDVRSVAEEILCREFDVMPDLSGENDLDDVAVSYAAPGGLFLTAVIGDELVGTGGILRVSDRDCELRRLYVREPFRRQGIASSLVGHLIDFVKKCGYKRILLQIGPEMEDTVDAYSRYGFHPDDTDLPRPGKFLSIRL